LTRLRKLHASIWCISESYSSLKIACCSAAAMGKSAATKAADVFLKTVEE
jgi:hypothetical protein